MAKRDAHPQYVEAAVERAVSARVVDERLPLPTAHFRRRAWLDFQRALDPLAPPRPLRRQPQ